MSSDRTDRPSESAQDVTWAWVADVYQGLPATPPETIERTAIAAGMVVTQPQKRGRKATARRLSGIAAAIALALGGWFIVAKSRSPISPRSPSRSVARSARTIGAFKPASDEPATPPSRGAVSTARLPVEPSTPDSTLPDSTLVATAPRVGAERQFAESLGSDTMTALVRRPSIRQLVAASPEIPDLSEADRGSLHAALGAGGLRELATVIARAAQDSVPAAPLLGRAMAGVAHGAASSVILAAVERRAAALRQARGVLGSNMTEDVLTAGADALEAGADALQLTEVQRRFPLRRLSVGLVVLTGLTTAGVPASDAVGALARGLDAGASDATLLAWQAGITADVASGTPPLAALRARSDTLGGSGHPGSEPRSPMRPTPSPPPSPIDPHRRP